MIRYRADGDGGVWGWMSKVSRRVRARVVLFMNEKVKNGRRESSLELNVSISKTEMAFFVFQNDEAAGFCSEFFEGYRVGEGADAIDLDGDRVAGLEPDGGLGGHADAVGRAGEDDGAGREGVAGAEEFDELGDGEDHIACVAALAGFAVEDGADPEGLGIGDFVGGDENGAER